jgi:hypothetical protein
MSSAQPRPGSLIVNRSSPPPRNVPVATDMMFVAGLSDKGPLKPMQVLSLQDFTNQFGSRQTYSVLYDSMETYFREGGVRAMISRVVGPAAVIASVNLDGSTVGAPYSLTASAKGPGAYANTLRVTITGGGTTTPYTITVSDTVLGTLEISPTLADQNAAVAWSQSSAWIDITLGAESSNPVAVSNAALTGGTDDRTNIVDANWLTALNRFTKDLGPGQVCAPGRTTATGQGQIRDHATNNNRFGLIDLVDTATVSTLNSAALALRSISNNNDRYAAAFAPWCVIPGIVPGTTRVVPPCTAVAAKIAAAESKGGSPNRPAAGYPDGVLSYVMGFSQVNAFDDGSGIDVTRDTMYSNGVNQLMVRYGLLEVFGWRTLTDPLGLNQDWVNIGNVRLNMAIVARALAISENYILDEIDGEGRLFKQFQGDLTGMLMDFYSKGSLYGRTPEEAFQVNVDNTVNTPTTIGNREMHAVISCRMSPDAELVFIEIVKVPASQVLAAV